MIYVEKDVIFSVASEAVWGTAKCPRNRRLRSVLLLIYSYTNHSNALRAMRQPPQTRNAFPKAFMEPSLIFPPLFPIVTVMYHFAVYNGLRSHQLIKAAPCHHVRSKRGVLRFSRKPRAPWWRRIVTQTKKWKGKQSVYAKKEEEQRRNSILFYLSPSSAMVWGV